MKVVMLDVDGVLADFIYAYTSLAVGYGWMAAPYGTTSHLYTSWDPPELTKARTDMLWAKINGSVDFWTTIPALWPLDVFKRLDEIQSYREVYFVTSRTGIHPLRQTQEWLTNHGIKNPAVIVSKRKGEIASAIKAGWFLDDKAGNAVYAAYHSPKTEVFLLDNESNRFDQGVLGSRVKRISHITPFLEAISE